MDSVRFFKELSRRQLRELSSVSEAPPGLQRVQHDLAVTANFRSWGDLLAANETERQLAVLMLRERSLTTHGFGISNFTGDYSDHRQRFAQARADLRADYPTVEVALRWLEANVERRKTINSSLTS